MSIWYYDCITLNPHNLSELDVNLKLVKSIIFELYQDNSKFELSFIRTYLSIFNFETQGFATIIMGGL